MYHKQIIDDRETRDDAMYLDGELIGFACTEHAVDVTLSQLPFDLRHILIPSARPTASSRQPHTLFFHTRWRGSLRAVRGGAAPCL
jgi:hypothetical protein